MYASHYREDMLHPSGSAAVLDSRQFWAWGFLIGDYLPLNTIKLGEATVVRIPSERLDESRHRHRSIQYVQGISLGHAVMPGQIFVLSDWALEWVVEADDFESARRIVQDTLAPIALTALNTITVQPYRLELMRIAELDSGGKVVGGIEQTFFPPDSSLRFCNPLPRPLSEAVVERINKRLDILGAHHVAGKAGHFFSDAVAASHFWSGHRVLAYAPLIGFHLCIETVLKAIGGPDSSAAVRSAEEEAVVKALYSSLGAGSDPRSRTAAVREANSSLDAISHRHFRTRLTAAALRLDLGEDTVVRLAAFYNFRNDHLGHSNKILDDVDLAYWIEEAHELARLVLAGYLDLLSGSSAEPIPERGEDQPLGPQRSWTSLRFQHVNIFLDPE